MSDLAERKARILDGIDLACGQGLEIGPLNNPLLRKGEAHIRYVDFADTATLRAKPYDSSIDPADIAEVDIVWGGHRLVEAASGPVDYIVAAHVIEHVPDLAGWLIELSQALKAGGVLSLVVPDKRFTFDLKRHDSTIGEVVEAYLHGYRRPSIRQMFDACFSAVVLDKQEAWTRDLTAAPLPKLVGEAFALPLAYEQAVLLASGETYIDSHCWVFTPCSFLALLDTLAQLRLLPFRVRSFSATEPGSFEFFVQLTPADPTSTDEIRASIAPFMSQAAASVPAYVTAQSSLERRVRQLRRVAAPLRRLQLALSARGVEPSAPGA